MSGKVVTVVLVAILAVICGRILYNELIAKDQNLAVEKTEQMP